MLSNLSSGYSHHNQNFDWSTFDGLGAVMIAHTKQQAERALKQDDEAAGARGAVVVGVTRGRVVVVELVVVVVVGGGHSGW